MRTIENIFKKKKCENCKHWDTKSYDNEWYKENGYVLMGECNKANLKDSNNMFDAICIGEGISGELITNKNFYCNQYAKNNS